MLFYFDKKCVFSSREKSYCPPRKKYLVQLVLPASVELRPQVVAISGLANSREKGWSLQI